MDLHSSEILVCDFLIPSEKLSLKIWWAAHLNIWQHLFASMHTVKFPYSLQVMTSWVQQNLDLV
jgi:hypothetical protein